MTLLQERLLKELPTATHIGEAMVKAGYSECTASQGKTPVKKVIEKYSQSLEQDTDEMMGKLRKRRNNLIEKCIQLAEAGNTKALEMLLDRLLPKKNEILLDRAPVEKELSDEEKAQLYGEWLRQYQGRTNVQG